MLLAAAVDTGVVVGAAGLLMTLFGYMFKELRRKDDSVWKIIEDRDKTIEALTRDRDYWRERAMGTMDEFQP